MAPFKIFAIVVLLAATQGRQVEATCTAADYTNYYNTILTCVKGFTTDIQACGNDFQGCFCNKMGEYFDCIVGAVGTLCINPATRSSLTSTLNTYTSIIDQHCDGAIVFPTYSVSFTIPNSNFVNFGSFTEGQYVQLCKNIFAAFDYSSTDYNTWCANWGTHITYSGLFSSTRRVRRGAGDALQVAVTIPDDQYLPPDTEFSTLTVPYTDGSGAPTSTSASVTGVTAAAVKGSATTASLPQSITVLATGLLTLVGASMAL